MLVRKDHFRASKAMQHRLSNFKNINVLFNSEIDEVLGDNVVEGIKIKNNINQIKTFVEKKVYIIRFQKVLAFHFFSFCSKYS